MFKPVRSNSEETNQSPSYPSKGSSTPPQTSTPATSAAPQSAPTARGNRLSADVEIKGKVTFPDELLIDGVIEGEIQSDGSLTIGENSKIKAEIRTRSLVVHGKVQGNITVQDHVDIRRTAEIIGDISAATVSMESGATLVGRSVIGKQTASLQSANKKNKIGKTSEGSSASNPRQAELPKT